MDGPAICQRRMAVGTRRAPCGDARRKRRRCRVSAGAALRTDGTGRLALPMSASPVAEVGSVRFRATAPRRSIATGTKLSLCR